MNHHGLVRKLRRFLKTVPPAPPAALHEVPRDGTVELLWTGPGLGAVGAEGL
ncbi:MAG: hypothetical protein JOZ00_23130 [Mycobacterium sp.]|uniref:hypothetical protein n=1 Tax=Mycobacterium sp. TaxID=1785 RepID=UPI001EB43549|nr:hypothetical protein [Mycobacterium sp.]MBV8789557.1 hypothetical protein [Mycobacterium sp.]